MAQTNTIATFAIASPNFFVAAS